MNMIFLRMKRKFNLLIKLNLRIMKKVTILLLTGVFLLGTANLFSQECVFYSPVEKGTVLTHSNFDKKDNLTGTSTQTVIDNYVKDGVQTVKIRNEYQDVEMDSVFMTELEMKANIERTNNASEFLKYKIRASYGLIINDKVISRGKNLSVEKLKEILIKEDELEKE